MKADEAGVCWEKAELPDAVGLILTHGASL